MPTNPNIYYYRPHDPNLEKAFIASEAGQVLGVDMDLPSRSWSVSQLKREDLCETINLLVNSADIFEIKPVTLNVLQRGIGLLCSFARQSQLGRTLMLVPRAEQNCYLQHLAEENDPRKCPKNNQTACCVLSLHAKKNIAFFKAVLMESKEAPLTMEDYRAPYRQGGGADCVLFTDASGKPKIITDPDYKPTCLGVYRPQTATCSPATARAFILPHSFLMGRDQQKTHVYNDMALLELLPVMSELLRDPAYYRKKSVHVYTDNQSTVHIFKNNKCKKLYLAYFLETLNFMIAALQIDLRIKWLKRRSCFAAEIADDATHAVFDNVEPDTVCTRHSLPTPLQEVMLETTSYYSHTLGTLRSRVKSYLLNIIPELTFHH